METLYLHYASNLGVQMSSTYVCMALQMRISKMDILHPQSVTGSTVGQSAQWAKFVEHVFGRNISNICKMLRNVEVCDCIFVGTSNYVQFVMGIPMWHYQFGMINLLWWFLYGMMNLMANYLSAICWWLEVHGGFLLCAQSAGFVHQAALAWFFDSLILTMADGAGTFAHVSETGRVPLHSTSGTHSNSRGASEELDTHGTFVRPAAERGTSIWLPISSIGGFGFIKPRASDTTAYRSTFRFPYKAALVWCWDCINITK
jgi:hypothetical protein